MMGEKEMLVRADTLKRWDGEPLQVMIDTATVTFEDGRQPEELKVEPYAVTRKYPSNIGEMWTREELLAIGLLRVIPATVPEGKRFAGEARYVRDGDVVRQEYDLEDLPPPPETVTISVEEHVRLVEDSDNWRAYKTAMANENAHVVPETTTQEK